MRKINRQDVLKMVLVLALVAGVGVSMAAIGRFTPTHAIVEPVYCGACHPDQVVELNRTTHLPHFANAVYGQANDRLAGGSGETQITKAEAVSAGCTMCHNTFDNRNKFYVTGYSLDLIPKYDAPGGTDCSVSPELCQYKMKFNDIVTTRTNKSTRYNVAVSTASVDQKVTLGTSAALNGTLSGAVTVSDPGSGCGNCTVGTIIGGTGNYTITGGKITFKAISATMTDLSTAGAKVDVGAYDATFNNTLVKLPTADGQVIYLPSTGYIGMNGGSNPTNVVVTTNNSVAAGIANGTVITNYTVTNTGIILDGSSSWVKALSGNSSTIDISATVTMRDVVVKVGMVRNRIGTNVSSIKIVVQNPGTSGLVAGDLLANTVDYTISTGTTPTDTFVSYVTFSSTSAKSIALSAGKGSVKITYYVAGTVRSLQEMWGDMSAQSPNMVGIFVDDKTKTPTWSTDLEGTGVAGYSYASCGSPDRGFCHSVQSAAGVAAAGLMQQNGLLAGSAGKGIYFQHEMAYTSAQYAAKQVKLCGTCHVNKLPPMFPDGEPMRVEASDVPQINYHGGAFVTNTSIVTSDFAHRQVQCIRCHGHAGIGTEEQGTGVQSP